MFWAAYPFAVLLSFLFSVIHLAPPAWAKADRNTEPRHDELTALIDELCESEGFDHRLGEEFRRLQSGTQDLAQTAPETMELVPLDELVPTPDMLLQQTPGGQTQQPGQPQQAPKISNDGSERKLTPVQTQPGAMAQPGAKVQPQRAPAVQPQQIQSQQIQPQQIQPQQAVCITCMDAPPVTKGKITR